MQQAMPAADSSLAAPIKGLSALDRHLNVPLVFGLLAAIVFFIAWNRGIALLYAMFAILVAVGLCSLVAARIMLRAASLRIVLPRQASVGDSIDVAIEVLPARWPNRRRMLKIDGLLPFAPDYGIFLPNAGNGLSHAEHVACARRGDFQLSSATVACGYPVGLITLTRLWSVQRAAITVYPRIHPVGSFAFSSDARRDTAEHERPVPAPGQDMFREVRDYRRGDNPRHIHWRSSARQGKLVVRQFDGIASNETWIVLDLNPAHHAGAGQNHSFERALEITASLVAHFCRTGMHCGIAGGLKDDGTPRLLIAPGCGARHLQIVLEALARLDMDSDAEYGAVLGALEQYYRPGQQWLLFRHDAGRIDVPTYLRRHRAPFWFRFDGDSFLVADAEQIEEGQPAQRQADGWVIRRDTDLASSFR